MEAALMGSKVLTIRLDEKLIKEIETVSKKLKRSKNRIIREVLENYLENLYDIEEAKRILVDKKDAVISHKEAKKEILSDWLEKESRQNR